MEPGLCVLDGEHQITIDCLLAGWGHLTRRLFLDALEQEIWDLLGYSQRVMRYSHDEDGTEDEHTQFGHFLAAKIS